MSGSDNGRSAASRARLPLAVLAVGVAFTTWMLLGLSTAPAVPLDDMHRGRPDGEACMECHAPDGAAPQPTNHTNRLNCFSCHRAR